VLDLDPPALSQAVRGLRNEARGRRDVHPYPRGTHIITPAPHLFPRDLHMRLSGKRQWFHSVLEVPE
jgi:hypothetical protein